MQDTAGSESNPIVVTGERPQKVKVSFRDEFGGLLSLPTFALFSPVFTELPLELIPVSTSPNEYLGTALEGLGEAIDAVLDALEDVLPRSELARLRALAATLKVSGRGVKYGELDVSTARDQVRSALTVALSELGGVGTAVLFGALAAYASSIAPLPPHVRAGLTVGSAVFGFLFDMAISDTGVYEGLARLITDAIFGSVEALGDVLTRIYDAILNGMDPLSEQSSDPFRLQNYDPAGVSTDSYLGVNPEWVNLSEYNQQASTQYFVPVYDPGGVDEDGNYTAPSLPPPGGGTGAAN